LIVQRPSAAGQRIKRSGLSAFDIDDLFRTKLFCVAVSIVSIIAMPMSDRVDDYQRPFRTKTRSPRI
jgi:hypothetical protein